MYIMLCFYFYWDYSFSALYNEVNFQWRVLLAVIEYVVVLSI